MFQHVLVFEDLLGGPIPSGLEVHHIDGDKANNFPSNLALVTSAGHKRFHDGEHGNKALQKEQVEELLVKHQGSLSAVAGELGCHHQTIRNRFPALVNLYRRKTPGKKDTETIAIVRKHAKDPDFGFRDMAKKYGLASQFVKRICQEEGIVWTYRHSSGQVKTRSYA